MVKLFDWDESKIAILEDCVSQGMNNVEIGYTLGTSSSIVQAKRTKMGIASFQLKAGKDREFRECLSCTRLFPSEGIHNRLCSLCKETIV